MANDTNVRGLFPIFNMGPQLPLLYFRANTAVAIYRGHPVFINNSGQCAIVSADSSANSNVAVGVAWDFLDSSRAGLPAGITVLQNSSTQGPFLPSSTDAYVGVTYDPMQLYLAEEDTGGAALNVNSAGQALS